MFLTISSYSYPRLQTGLIASGIVPESTFDAEFKEDLNNGRRGIETDSYFNCVYYFGPIFCFHEEGKSLGFAKAVSRGVTVTKMLGYNMESLMRTIVEGGLTECWIPYMESDRYKDWLDKRVENKPVSIYCVFLCCCNVSFFLTLLFKKCFLPYTGSQGKVQSTAQGRGWNNDGIKCFNKHMKNLAFELEEDNNGNFDKKFAEFCKKKIRNAVDDTEDVPVALRGHTEEPIEALTFEEVSNRARKRRRQVGEI